MKRKERREQWKYTWIIYRNKVGDGGKLPRWQRRMQWRESWVK